MAVFVANEVISPRLHQLRGVKRHLIFTRVKGPFGAHTRGRFAAGLSHVLRNDQMPYILAFALHV